MTIYVNEIGKVFRVECVAELLGATVTELHVRKPDGTVVEWSADISDESVLVYSSVEGDLDQVGIYTLQSYVENQYGKYHGDATQFLVLSEFTR